MDTALRLATPISVNHRAALQPGKRYAALTFDDGFLNVLDNAVPELVRRNIPATIFVVAGLLGKSPSWDTFGADYIRSERLISAAQLQGLPRDLITIGSHTTSHAWLPALTAEQARQEINGSRDQLRALLDREIELFSFPFGACNQELIEVCREAGYTRVFTIIPRLAFSDPTEFVTGRTEANPNDWPIEFRLKLFGAYRWLPAIFEMKKRSLEIFSSGDSISDARKPTPCRHGP